jgi:hypothetical protein
MNHSYFNTVGGNQATGFDRQRLVAPICSFRRFSTLHSQFGSNRWYDLYFVAAMLESWTRVSDSQPSLQRVLDESRGRLCARTTICWEREICECWLYIGWWKSSKTHLKCDISR